MAEARYIDPNSGAAPQPGGQVAGGVDPKEVTKSAPTSDTEAEVQRQALLEQEQEKALSKEKAKEPAQVETPDLAEPTKAKSSTKK